MLRMWFSIAAIALGACTVHAKTGTAAMVSLANEKVLLSPLVDSSSLQTLSGWPKDSATRSLLLVHFRELHDALVAEFRRCEKYGYFEVVDDRQRQPSACSVSSGRIPLQRTPSPCPSA